MITFEMVKFQLFLVQWNGSFPRVVSDDNFSFPMFIKLNKYMYVKFMKLSVYLNYHIIH